VSTESRRHRRFPIEIIGTLELQDDGGLGPAFGISITDVAPGGLGLTLRRPIPVGARVTLLVQGERIHGVVSHCENFHGDFSAGIAVDSAGGAIARIGWLACLRPSAHPVLRPRPFRPVDSRAKR
jgi:hypothetical protein